MEYNSASLIFSVVFGICTGGICAAIESKTIPQSRFLLIGTALAFSIIGAWGIWASYPFVLLALITVLLAKKAKLKDAFSAAALSSAAGYVILIFSGALIAPSLEAYSYTLNDAFFYYAPHSPVIITISLIAALFIMLLTVWLCRGDNGIGGTLAVCIISLSIAFVVVMILHMCFGKVVDYNAKHLKTPLPYAILIGSVSVLCMIIACIIMHILKNKLRIPVGLGSTKQFYFILAAIVCTVIFYCYENTILNNYVSFDNPQYKYIISILIVLMIITILTALLSICSYILKTRDEQSHIEHEAAITRMYRDEIRNIQRDIFDFKHDYVKIYSSMSAFILNHEYDKLSDFFDHNIVPLQKELFDMDAGSKELSLIDDEAVQGLLYSFIIKAKNAGVTLLTDIRDHVPAVSIPVLDLNRIIGIFLDNAIEQAVNSDKMVCFAAIRHEDCTLFVITNSASQLDIEKIFTRGESSKGTGRGRGLTIARKLCSMHDELSMNTYARNGKFICELYIE